MDSQLPESPDERPIPYVDTASFTREGETLIITLDGEEVVLPGGRVDACLEDNKIRVHLYTTFHAGTVDLTSDEIGS